MVKIGHARYDENGRSSGGKRGDQTGKEVRIDTWYKRSGKQKWKVLRHPDSKTREAIASFVENACANDNIGYNQSDRNSLHDELIKNGYWLSEVGLCNCDCSSLVTASAIYAGVASLEYKGNAPTTSTMEKVFVKAGFNLLEGDKYSDTDKYLVRGDILFCAGHHTLVVLDDGTTEYPTLRKGSKGNAVKVWQMLLGLEADGIFGAGTEKAVKEHQTFLGLEADGIIGKKTWKYGFKVLL